MYTVEVLVRGIALSMRGIALVETWLACAEYASLLDAMNCCLGWRAAGERARIVSN